MKENMHFGASAHIFHRAQELRNKMTNAEQMLWYHLQKNEWKLKFRRQHAIYRYVVDFYCHPLKLVIELDGGIHDIEEVKRYDEVREANLKSFNLTVLRFRNHEIINDISKVMSVISHTIKKCQRDFHSEVGVGGGMKDELTIIKIGGNIVDDEKTLAAFLSNFASITGKKILVHGGGKIATRIGDSLGIQSKYVDGRRITDADTIDLVTMVYGGLINKKIVAQLQSLHCNAIGLTGADANLIPANKRPVKDIDYGFVGDVKSDQLSAKNWKVLLDGNFIPVVAPLTHDGEGHILNTNADTIAQELAKALSKSYEVNLIYSFEKAGVLLDANDESTVINSIDAATFEKLKSEQKIFAGMIPKLDNAFAALNSGVKKIIIGKADNIADLLAGKSGTTISN